jgi:hypothetical protein
MASEVAYVIDDSNSYTYRYVFDKRYNDHIFVHDAFEFHINRNNNNNNMNQWRISVVGQPIEVWTLLYDTNLNYYYLEVVETSLGYNSFKKIGYNFNSPNVIDVTNINYGTYTVSVSYHDTILTQMYFASLIFQLYIPH